MSKISGSEFVSNFLYLKRIKKNVTNHRVQQGYSLCYNKLKIQLQTILDLNGIHLKTFLALVNECIKNEYYVKVEAIVDLMNLHDIPKIYIIMSSIIYKCQKPRF